jgi:hypothetical protein
MHLKKSILAPFTTTRTLKILYIRQSIVDIEDPTMTWDIDSDNGSMADDGLGADSNPDVITAYDDTLEDGSSDKGTSSSRKSLRITYSTASLDSFDAAKILSLPPKLREFANWAFGPDGLPTLKLLAFGDFSYKYILERKLLI